MKIQNVVTIDGNIVDKIFQKGDLSMYQHEISYNHSVIYFVKNDTVIFKQIIRADCNQNEGLISEIDFEGVN